MPLNRRKDLKIVRCSTNTKNKENLINNMKMKNENYLFGNHKGR
jgi:hypothetical protein